MQRYLLAFIFAGVLSVIGQLLLFAWSGALGADDPFVGPCALACFGVLGLLVALTGVIPRMMALTVMGVIMPTAGIVMGVASTVEEAYRETGSLRAAFARGGRIPLLVLGGGTIIVIGVRIVVFVLFGDALSLSFEAPVLTAPVQLLAAFVVGGAIAAIAEALLSVTGMEPPVLMLWIMVFGSLLAVFNLDAAPVFCNAGFSTSILSAGQGVYDTFGLLVNGVSWEMFAAVIIVFVWVSVLGLAGGLIRIRIAANSR